MVAPAGPPDPVAFDAGLAILAGRYRLVHGSGPDPVGPPGLPYLSADDAFRAAELNRALGDPEVEAILCARGGYGCSRILRHLDGEALVRRRPLIVGFSDITALHAWATRLGVPSIHGPVVTQLSRLPTAHVEALFALLEGRALPRLSGLETLVPGQAVGPLVGGNLALLGHLCGTPYFPDCRGRILLLEEVNEAPYRLDRLLTQLRLCGALHEAAGILLGQFLACDGEQGIPPTFVEARAVLQDRLSDLGIPVALGAPIGHGPENLALPLGPLAELDADAGTLTFGSLAEGSV